MNHPFRSERHTALDRSFNDRAKHIAPAPRRPGFFGRLLRRLGLA